VGSGAPCTVVHATTCTIVPATTCPRVRASACTIVIRMGLATTRTIAQRMVRQDVGGRWPQGSTNVRRCPWSFVAHGPEPPGKAMAGKPVQHRHPHRQKVKHTGKAPATLGLYSTGIPLPLGPLQTAERHRRKESPKKHFETDQQPRGPPPSRYGQSSIQSTWWKAVRACC